MDSPKLVLQYNFYAVKKVILNIHYIYFFQEKEKEEEAQVSKKRKQEMVPNRNFAEKYEKLLGRESGLAAARVATPNKHFGFGMFFIYFF